MRSKRKKERQQQQESVKQTKKQEERAFHKAVVHITQTLGETDWKPRIQIERIVQHLGADFAMAKLQETEQVESQGGLMLTDGSRRRTKGGVFFYLVRQWLKGEKRQEDVKEIFYKNLHEPKPAESSDEHNNGNNGRETIDVHPTQSEDTPTLIKATDSKPKPSKRGKL